MWRSIEDMEAAKLVALKMIILDQARTASSHVFYPFKSKGLPKLIA